jgi:hypothetical protein
MATTNATAKTCPVTGSFSWANPLHLAAFFALLPFAIKGVMFAFNALAKGVDALVK